MNTEQIKKVSGSLMSRIGTANPVATTAWRGLSAATMAWCLYTFATKESVDGLRSWVKSLSQSRTEQMESVDKRIDALERNAAYLTGRLGYPMPAETRSTITVKTNTQ